MSKKCLGYDPDYKHCPDCPNKDGPSPDGTRKICYSSKYPNQAKPCAVCGGYYPGDCRCSQPCHCDSCNTQRDLDQEVEESELDDEEYWTLMEEEYS